MLIFLRSGHLLTQIFFSRFHQLECLAILCKALQRAGHGQDFGEDWRKADEEWPKCLDYLHQVGACSAQPMICDRLIMFCGKMVKCYADATIEREDLGDPGGSESEVQGTMTWRTCRSADALYRLRAGKQH